MDMPLPKPANAPVPDLKPAVLVSPERRAVLAQGFEKIVDLEGRAASDLTADEASVFIVDLNCDGAVEIIDALSHNAPGAKLLVLGDALTAPAVKAMLRVKSSDLLASSADLMDIQRAAFRLAELAPETPPSKNHCWVFTGAVGGAGATTLAIEAACAAIASDPSNSVCIVDLNLADGMVASYLEGGAKLDLMGLLEAPERLDPTLLNAYSFEHETGISLICAPRNPDINEFVSAELVLRLLDTVCAVFSHVIVDMPRARQSWTKPILAGVDEVLVVSEFTVPSLHAAADMAREIDALRQDAPDTKLVLNRMSDAKNEFSVSRAGKAIEREISAVVRSDWKSAREAANLGLPIAKVKPRSILVKDAVALTRQLDPEITEQKPKSKWMFG
ncbi:MAG: hypothetical protein AAFQ84_03695 [Pseudomonadota bacterium]